MAIAGAFPPEQVASDVPAIPASDAPFDLAAVVAALDSLAADGKERALHAALTAYPPLLHDHEITLTVDNDLFLAKARELHTTLLAHLQQTLGNRHITLQFCLYNEQQGVSPGEKRLYTAQDKFDYFLEQYPEVQMLRDYFGLEIV